MLVNKTYEEIMFRKFFNLLIIIFINVFLLSGCFDAPNDFVVPSWDVKLHIPVANKTYTLKEAIDKDTTFVHSYTNPENLGLLYFGDNQPIEKITLGDNLSVDPFSASASERSEERRVGKECRSRWSPYH